MKMHALSGGRLRMKARAFFASASPDATIELPCCCFLLRHPQGNVLFDTGCHPKVAINLSARWGVVAKAVKPIMDPEDNVITSLAEIGLAPDDIDLVVNSHLHMDYCGCNSFFKNATGLVHEKELLAAKDDEGQGYFSEDWDCGLDMRPIAEEWDVFGDEKIVLVPVPGHSAGTIGALVNLDTDGSFFIAADAVSVEQDLRKGNIPAGTWNPECFSRSIEHIRRLESGGAQVLFGHDARQWAGLRKGRQAFSEGLASL